MHVRFHLEREQHSGNKAESVRVRDSAIFAQGFSANKRASVEPTYTYPPSREGIFVFHFDFMIIGRFVLDVCTCVCVYAVNTVETLV